MHNSPTGTLMKTRANGDILKYHPRTNHYNYLYDNTSNQLTENTERYFEWDAAKQVALI